MLPKSLLYLLAALMLILGTGQPVPAQPDAGKSLKKQTCGDLWPVERHGKWGYIDKTGRLIIPYKFDSAEDFSEGLAAVALKEKIGYIDETGKFVIPPRFDRVGDFSGGGGSGRCQLARQPGLYQLKRGNGNQIHVHFSQQSHEG